MAQSAVMTNTPFLWEGTDRKGNKVKGKSMAANEAALRIGSLDAIQVFQPYAEHLVRDGVGHIWYAAANRGPTSYTSFYTTERNLVDQRDAMLAMTHALFRTQKWLHAAEAETIAETIAPYFAELKGVTLTGCIARYKSLGLWGRDPMLPETGFERLKRSCLSGGLIERGAEYGHCVDNSLARLVVEADPPSM